MTVDSYGYAGDIVPAGQPAKLHALADRAKPATRGVNTPSSSKAPTDERFTDAGNARRLVAEHGHRFRWAPAWGTWLVWTGTRWKKDAEGEIMQAAKNVVSDMFLTAITLDDAARKKAVGWAMASENANRLDAMIRLARTEPPMPVEPSDLDADPWLLNCVNGTVDLRTGDLSPHDPADLITKSATVAYRSDATCPAWDALLEHAMPDPELRRYFAELVGLSIVGKVMEHVLVIVYGPGGTGKTTTSTALATVLGGYAQTCATDVLVAKDQHPTGVADLLGARLVAASEFDEGRRLAEGTVKALTGGDRVKARLMRQDFFEFEPSHTIWLSTNHRPIITGTDSGIWRRVKVVPFEQVVDPEHQDRALPGKLAAEGPGVLAWALRGCLDWQANGLVEPAAVTAAVGAYRKDMDSIGTFIDETCTVLTDAKVSALDLYGQYSAWADANGERPRAQKRFGQSLTERGFDRRKYGQANRWHWFGLGLARDEENQ